MKPETKFWQEIEPHIKGFKQRIETPIAKGVPDVYVCYKGMSYWIETKVWEPNVGVLLRKEQYAWANMLQMSGGKAFTIVKSDSGILLFTTAGSKVESYGKQGIYVKVIDYNKPKEQTFKDSLQGVLQNFLFT
jgi:nitrous oxidase accessory protein NosD